MSMLKKIGAVFGGEAVSVVVRRRRCGFRGGGLFWSFGHGQGFQGLNCSSRRLKERKRQ